MRISVSQARARLSELIRISEAGNEVVFTHRGRAVAKLVPILAAPAGFKRDPSAIFAAIEKLQAAAAKTATAGSSAARSQDFLYGEKGMPG